MILPYTLRLMCLCLASFFAVNAILGLAIWAVAPRVVRVAETMRPRRAALLLLFSRTLPAILGAAMVAALCIPSYLWLEPASATERVGVGFCIIGLLGLLGCAHSLLRSARAMWLSFWQAQRCKRHGRRQRRGRNGSPLIVVDGEEAMLALMGMTQPRIVVSNGVLRSLSSGELEAALEHEEAHRKSRDNLKRLLLLLTPEIFPFSHAFAALERRWARFTEWAADDDATAGDSRRSLSLAAALVRMAQMGTARQLAPLATPFLAADDEISARVERLLGRASIHENSTRRGSVVLSTATAVVAALAIASMIRPATLHAVHYLLERFIH